MQTYNDELASCLDLLNGWMMFVKLENYLGQPVRGLQWLQQGQLLLRADPNNLQLVLSVFVAWGRGHSALSRRRKKCIFFLHKPAYFTFSEASSYKLTSLQLLWNTFKLREKSCNDKLAHFVQTFQKSTIKCNKLIFLDILKSTQKEKVFLKKRIGNKN